MASPGRHLLPSNSSQLSLGKFLRQNVWKVTGFRCGLLLIRLGYFGLHHQSSLSLLRNPQLVPPPMIFAGIDLHCSQEQASAGFFSLAHSTGSVSAGSRVAPQGLLGGKQSREGRSNLAEQESSWRCSDRSCRHRMGWKQNPHGSDGSDNQKGKNNGKSWQKPSGLCLLHYKHKCSKSFGT